MQINHILIAIGVSIMWGLEPILFKRLITKFDKVSVLIICGMFYFVGLLALGYRYSNKVIKDLSNVTPYDVSLMFFSAVIAGLMGNMVYLFLLESHNSYIITTLVSIAPLFTLLFAYLFTKEDITKWGIMGTMLIVFGVLMIAYDDKQYKIEEFLNFL